MLRLLSNLAEQVPRKKPVGTKGIPEASDRLAAERAAAKASTLVAKQSAGQSSSSSCSEEDGSDEDATHAEADGAVEGSEHPTPGDAPKPKRMKKKLKRLSVCRCAQAAITARASLAARPDSCGLVSQVNLTMCKYRVIRDTVEWLGERKRYEVCLQCQCPRTWHVMLSCDLSCCRVADDRKRDRVAAMVDGHERGRGALHAIATPAEAQSLSWNDGNSAQM